MPPLPPPPIMIPESSGTPKVAQPAAAAVPDKPATHRRIPSSGETHSDKTYMNEVPAEFYKRVHDSDDVVTRFRGAVALLMLWAVWLTGSFSVFWFPWLLYRGYYMAAFGAALVMAYPYVFEVKQSPAFVRFILSGAGWFKGGTCLYIEKSLKDVDTSESILLCQHPHGLFTYGFVQNGSAARIDARVPEMYVPKAFHHMKPNALALVEPMLFKVPLIRHFILAFGCARPATKGEMFRLMAKKTPLGLLPGGSEEIILSHQGCERVYIKKRKGFIKYALQHGYTICIGYTFGESDSYRTLDWGVGFRMWLLKNFKIPAFACWGIWWCPLLPRGHVAMETVVGNPFRLPKVENPSQEEIDKYHAIYIEKLKDLFYRNRDKFGYKDRELEIY